MIQVSPREYSIGFGAYLQGRFSAIGGAGGIDLQIMPVKGEHSELAVHGKYEGPNFSSEFTGEFYLGHERKLKFSFSLNTPKREKLPFGEQGFRVHERGLTRLLGEVKEEVKNNGRCHHYNVSCNIRRDLHQIGNMNEVYQDLIEYLVKRSFGLVSGQIKPN